MRARAPLLRPGGGPSVEYSDAQALDLAWFVGQDPGFTYGGDILGK